MSKGQFKIQKVSDVGTSNPIVARLSIGLHDIVQMAQIKKENQGLINLTNYNVMDLAVANNPCD